MKLVKIKWIDSKAGPNRWEYRDGLKPLKPVRCTSVGFVIDETLTTITLVQTKSKTQVCGRITIPTACIIKCCEL